MREEARASPRLKTLEIGILLGKYCGNYLQEIEASSDSEMVRALTKYDLDWDYIAYLASEAGWQSQKRDYDAPPREDDEEESEDAPRYELQFTPLPQPDKELQKIMDAIKAQRILVNILFSDRFGFELFKEAEPDSRIICIPCEGFTDWNALLCVAGSVNYVIETIDANKIRRWLKKTFGNVSRSIADRVDWKDLKGIALLQGFLECQKYPKDKWKKAIQALRDIQRLRSATKPIHFTDAGFKKFVEQYGLEDKLDPETKEGNFYALIYKVLEVALEALDELHQTLIEKETT